MAFPVVVSKQSVVGLSSLPAVGWPGSEVVPAKKLLEHMRQKPGAKTRNAVTLRGESVERGQAERAKRRGQLPFVAKAAGRDLAAGGNGGGGGL